MQENNNNTIVVVADASVVVKWFVQEKLTEKALLLRDDYLNGKITIACPDLLGYEVINALRYKPSFGVQDLKQVADTLEKYNFLTYSILCDNNNNSNSNNNGLVGIAIEFALKYGLTIYDASYVAIAGHLDDSIVYTADTKLVEKVSDSKLVTNISEYGIR